MILRSGRLVHVSGAIRYDGVTEPVDCQRTYEPDDDIQPPFTQDERREIAEEMVRRWRKWGGLGAYVG